MKALRSTAAACALLLLASGGCTSSSDLDLAEVSGKVTWDDGTPVHGARVTFFSENDPNAATTGTTNEQGEYTLMTNGEEGAVIGKNRVFISLYVNPDGSPITGDDESGMDMGMAEAGVDIAAIEDKENGNRSDVVKRGGPRQAIAKKYSDKKESTLTFDVPADGSEAADFKVGKKLK